MGYVRLDAARCGIFEMGAAARNSIEFLRLGVETAAVVVVPPPHAIASHRRFRHLVFASQIYKIPRARPSCPHQLSELIRPRPCTKNIVGINSSYWSLVWTIIMQMHLCCLFSCASLRSALIASTSIFHIDPALPCRYNT